MNYYQRVFVALVLIIAGSVINLTAMHLYADSHSLASWLGGFACSLSLIAGKVWS